MAFLVIGINTSAVELVIHSIINSFSPKNNLIRISVGRNLNVIGEDDLEHNRVLPDYFRSLVKGKEATIHSP
jgi:hypothetical protein